MRRQPLILIAITTTISGSSQPAWATDYMETALRFRDSANAVYQQGVDVCGGDCEPELSGPIADLGSSLSPLNDAIATGDPPTINNAVSNTASILGPLCNVLHVDCPSPPFSPSGQKSKPKGSLDSPCCSECADTRDLCYQLVDSTHTFCINNINEYVGCRLDTPFCDYRGAPFDAAAYSFCRNNAFYRVYLPECRCPFPPGQAERQGGCPDFFGRPVGLLETASCEVPDGQGCARCCNAKCVPGDPRLSCLGGNREECDVCEWARRTQLAGNSMRTSLCEAAAVSRAHSCYQSYVSCERVCDTGC